MFFQRTIPFHWDLWKFELNKTESNEKKKVFKTTKEKFKEMAEINPVLLELQKRLELDFEY